MKPDKQYTNWTDKMYNYLAWCLFKNMYGTTEWFEEEEKKIALLKKNIGNVLDDKQRKIVENRARRLSDEHDSYVLDEMGRMYKDEFCGEEYDYGEDDFVKPHITYDNKHYEIWTNAVRKRLTARMTYDSATSGMSERLIDPYQTSAPYGQGYCHLRKEVRKFRFDRIIDIELTNKTFIKPKNW